MATRTRISQSGFLAFLEFSGLLQMNCVLVESSGVAATAVEKQTLPGLAWWWLSQAGVGSQGGKVAVPRGWGISLVQAAGWGPHPGLSSALVTLALD